MRDPDVERLVKPVERAKIGTHDGSLTPNWRVVIAPEEGDEDFDFEEVLRSIRVDLTGSNEEAAELAARIAKNFLLTYQTQPSCGLDTQSTSLACRRPQIDVRAAGNVVSWPSEPRFSAAGSRKLSLVRNQEIL